MLIPDYVSKYTDRFKSGDPVTLVWDMLPPSAPPAPTPAPGSAAAQSPASGPAPIPPPLELKTDSDHLRAIFPVAPDSKAIDWGYVLPAEFVAADSTTVTARLRVSGKSWTEVSRLQPGQRFLARSPLTHPGGLAVINDVASESNGNTSSVRPQSRR